MSRGETKSAPPWSQPERNLRWPSREKSKRLCKGCLVSLPLQLLCLLFLLLLLPQPMQPDACCWFCPCSHLLPVWFPLSEGRSRHCKLTKTQTELVLPHYGAVFLSSWHKSERGWGGRAGERKRERGLTQGSGLFIFLPAATCYPHRGSPKTSYGLGWRGTSNLSCRLGPSQWITTLSRPYFFF